MKQEDKLCQNFTPETDFSFSILQSCDFLKLYTCNKVGSPKNSYSKLLTVITIHVTGFKKNLSMFLFLRSYCTSHNLFCITMYNCCSITLIRIMVQKLTIKDSIDVQSQFFFICRFFLNQMLHPVSLYCIEASVHGYIRRYPCLFNSVKKKILDDSLCFILKGREKRVLQTLWLPFLEDLI